MGWLIALLIFAAIAVAAFTKGAAQVAAEHYELADRLLADHIIDTTESTGRRIFH